MRSEKKPTARKAEIASLERENEKGGKKKHPGLKIGWAVPQILGGPGPASCGESKMVEKRRRKKKG